MKNAEKLAFLIYDDLDKAMELLKRSKKNLDMLHHMYLLDVEDKDFPCLEYALREELKKYEDET